MVAFSLLLLGVCWDPGDEGGRTVTALPTGSAGAAAAALPSDFGTARAPSGDADATPALPGRSAAPPTLPGDSATPALPGNSSGSPAARPGPSRAPGTGMPQALASRTAPAQGSGPHPSKPRTDSRTAPPQRPTAGTPNPARPQHPTRTQAPAPRPLPRSRATRLLIPHLRIDAPIMPLGLDRERRLTAPPEDNPKLVGWYRHGASPGEQGTAVAVGHLDTDRGPAVFAGLTELKRGRVVEARRADGRIAVYTVDAIKSYEKARFPNQEVYGARGRPELRLITCGGAYDRRTGYSGNVVVFAHLTAIR
ncbi:class F sortase [Streptomyces violaceus]|uniref:class F sortase n=1 Tax=Streptomyces violaceus TaxID=1936 RepID=UPI002E2CC550|nr:class F sortase [Streptomyces violaceus]